MYSTGSSACTAGLGRPSLLGRRSHGYKFYRTKDDREREMERERIKDLPNGLEDRAVKSWGKLKEEYKEEVMVEDAATLFHLGSEMAPENLPSECKTGGKEAGGEAEVSVGECVLTKPFKRLRYELVVNLCIL
ncbi:hypothetical protein NQZ68_032076 [Dissostichus eleginoides]|nr:hypothetical protein NQZ68_032076 [Dissostichus eleginoides]